MTNNINIDVIKELISSIEEIDLNDINENISNITGSKTEINSESDISNNEEIININEDSCESVDIEAINKL